MDWNLTECYGNSNSGIFNSNFSFQGSENLSSNSADDINEQRRKDQDFINKFVEEIKQKKESRSRGNVVKISDAKRLFVEIIKEKQNIKQEIFNLNVNDENFELKYKTLAKELQKINDRILKFASDVKSPLAVALCKRSKKRKAIKKRHENLKALKNLEKQNILEKHRIIDKLLDEKSREVEIVKQEVALKRQADTVLHEVRRKKYEAKKMLNLLTALAKLRELRSTEEKRRGGYSSEQLTETFNKVMSRFQDLWEKQLDVYKLEEKGLKIMLEENTVPHKKESEFETNLLQWEKALFGDIANDKYEKLLNFPETDFQALIQVRQDWDQFLTKNPTLMASGIPPGWVLPPETEDELWKAFTKTNKQTLTVVN